MLGFGKAGAATIAVADVDGESAGVAILSVGSSAPSRVLLAERSTLSMEERSKEASASGVLAELGKATEKLLASYATKFKDRETPHVAKAYAVIRVPWTHSKTISAESTFPQEVIVEKKMINALAEEALRRDTEFDHAKTLEASVVRVELNGYPTGKPEKKRAKSIAVSALQSECDPAMRSGVAEALQRTFSCPPPILRSGTRALLSVLEENRQLLQDCTVISMASRATNIVIIRKGIVSDVVSVPEGSSSILSRIAEGKLPQEALTMMRLLAEDQCEGEACEAMKAAIARAEPELVKVFGAVLEKTAGARRIPNDVILFAPHDLSEWFLHFLSRIDFAPFTVTTRPFSCKLSGKKDFEHTLAFENGADPDPELAIACALVNKEERAAT